MNREEARNKRHWFALYTRPRFERKINQALQDLNIETFLPLRTETRYWSDRKKQIEVPVFPSYIFIHADLKERHLAYQPDGVVRVVSFNGEPARIPDEQITAVKRILESGYTPIVSHNFKKGDLVEIVAGPLTGLQGYIDEERGSNYFTVFVEGIRQAVAIYLNAAHLKPIR